MTTQSSVSFQPLTMDDVPEFAVYLHQLDHQLTRTFGIPNVVQRPEVEFDLYVNYPNGYWNKFNLNDSNSHQLAALQQFVKSGEKTKNVSVPHSQGGMFKATFSKNDAPNENYNTIYSYRREDGNHVRFLVSYPAQIGFINRISCEPVA